MIQLPLFPNRVSGYRRGEIGRPPEAREEVLILVREKRRIELRSLAEARERTVSTVRRQVARLVDLGLVKICSLRPTIVEVVDG